MHTIADHSESEEEEEEETPTERPEGTSFPTHSSMEVMEEDSHRKLVDYNVGNYDWLIEHFKSEKWFTITTKSTASDTCH